MANVYTKALKQTSTFEGSGVVKEPTGDISFKGIRQNVYNDYNKQLGVPTKDVREISDEERNAFIQSVFIKQPKLDQLPKEVFSTMFDFGFNASPKRAVKALQRVIGATEDGRIGPETIRMTQEALATGGIDVINNAILNERQKHNESLSPKHNKYKEGLKARVDAQRRE